MTGAVMAESNGDKPKKRSFREAFKHAFSMDPYYEPLTDAEIELRRQLVGGSLPRPDLIGPCRS